LERDGLVETIPTNQNPVPAATTKVVSSLREATSHRRAVNQLLTSVVRENRTLRSVGAGGG